MMERNIGFKERRYIEELRILTKATALDCIIDERFERIIYIIQKGDMGLAIGKKGENIRRMQNVLGKRIEMVEYADEQNAFIANIFRPVEISTIEMDPLTGTLIVSLQKKSGAGNNFTPAIMRDPPAAGREPERSTTPVSLMLTGYEAS